MPGDKGYTEKLLCPIPHARTIVSRQDASCKSIRSEFAPSISLTVSVNPVDRSGQLTRVVTLS